MKNIALALGLSILLSACSSGTTIADLPSNVTSRYQGTFVNTPGTQRGTVILDLVDDNAGGVSGNIIFQSNGESCLRNGPIADGGTNTGFNVQFTIDQAAQRFQVVTQRTIETEIKTDPDTIDEVIETNTEIQTDNPVFANDGVVGTITNVDVNGPNTSGNVTTTITTTTTVTTSAADQAGTINVQLTSSNEGAQLNGTYTSTSDSTLCSNQSGSGTISLSR